MRTEIPICAEGRKKLHQQLLSFATNAVNTGTTKGLAKFISSFEDPRFEATLHLWFSTYTPIQSILRGIDHNALMVPHSLKGVFDLSGARLNPYYSMPSQAPQVAVMVVAPSNMRTHQSSELDLVKKGLKHAVNEFLDVRSLESKQKLLRLINDFPTQGESKRGSPFLQGGAPGLGRRG